MLSSTKAIEGISVFVVEDEALVLLNLEDMLDELGCLVVGPAMRLDKATKLLDEGAVADVAILDVNVAGEMVFPLARKLLERQIPIVFATGYGKVGLPDEFHNNPVLQKPYTMNDVEAGLALALNGARHDLA